jgi:hypothetical protein
MNFNFETILKNVDSVREDIKDDKPKKIKKYNYFPEDEFSYILKFEKMGSSFSRVFETRDDLIDFLMDHVGYSASFLYGQIRKIDEQEISF